MITLIILAGFFKAVMDKLQFHWDRSIFAINPEKYKPVFWNPQVSWANKYDLTQPGYSTEKFKFSTTLLVFLTDAWHLSQMCMTLCLFVGLSFIGYFSDSFLELLIKVVVARVLYGFTFELFFKHILEDNGKIRR